MSKVYVNNIHNKAGVQAMAISSTGIITPTKPIIANLYLTTATHDHTEQSWHTATWDGTDIDTYGSVANTTDNRFDIPVAGYYEIYCQMHFGTTGGSHNIRDTAMIVIRTPSGGSEEVISSVHHRHYAGGEDTSDVTEVTHTIVQCAVNDQIYFKHNANTDDSQAYDIYALIAEDENGHVQYPLSGTNIAERATHTWIRRVG